MLTRILFSFKYRNIEICRFSAEDRSYFFRVKFLENVLDFLLAIFTWQEIQILSPYNYKKRVKKKTYLKRKPHLFCSRLKHFWSNSLWSIKMTYSSRNLPNKTRACYSVSKVILLVLVPLAVQGKSLSVSSNIIQESGEKHRQSG